MYSSRKVVNSSPRISVSALASPGASAPLPVPLPAKDVSSRWFTDPSRSNRIWKYLLLDGNVESQGYRPKRAQQCRDQVMWPNTQQRKLLELGGKVVTMSDSDGYIYDPDGIDSEKLNYIMELKNLNRGRIREYAETYGCKYVEGQNLGEKKVISLSHRLHKMS